MARILEIDYWKVIPGRGGDVDELAWQFSKFAHKNLDAAFRSGFVRGGRYIDHVVFSFLWESNAGYEKWKVDCKLNKEFQDWLTIVEDSGQEYKRVDSDIIHLVS